MPPTFSQCVRTHRALALQLLDPAGYSRPGEIDLLGNLCRGRAAVTKHGRDDAKLEVIQIDSHSDSLITIRRIIEMVAFVSSALQHSHGQSGGAQTAGP